jgi:hypothetical protein
MIFLDFFEEEREMNGRARVRPDTKRYNRLLRVISTTSHVNPALVKKGDEKKTRRGRVDKVGPSVEETELLILKKND